MPTSNVVLHYIQTYIPLSGDERGKWMGKKNVGPSVLIILKKVWFTFFGDVGVFWLVENGLLAY